MDGNITTESGSFEMEVSKSKPDPERKGKVIYDDCLNIWFPSKYWAWLAVESLLQQIKNCENEPKRDIHLNFCGELRFEKED